MYALTRIEAKPGVFCWQVFFRRRGKPYNRAFFDQKLGGPTKALKAAIAWRDDQLAKARILTNREFRQIRRLSNGSGVPGVSFVPRKNQPRGNWQARVKLPDGREIARTFAVQKYGNRGAFRRAVETRKELLLLVEDRPFLHSPAARRIAAAKSAKSSSG